MVSCTATCCARSSSLTHIHLCTSYHHIGQTEKRHLWCLSALYCIYVVAWDSRARFRYAYLRPIIITRAVTIIKQHHQSVSRQQTSSKDNLVMSATHPPASTPLLARCNVSRLELLLNRDLGIRVDFCVINQTQSISYILVYILYNGYSRYNCQSPWDWISIYVYIYTTRRLTKYTMCKMFGRFRISDGKCWMRDRDVNCCNYPRYKCN